MQTCLCTSNHTLPHVSGIHCQMHASSKWLYFCVVHRAVVRNPPTKAGVARDLGSIPGQEDPLEEEMAPAPEFLPGEFHGQRNLAGYSSWGCEELDTTE